MLPNPATEFIVLYLVSEEIRAPDGNTIHSYKTFPIRTPRAEQIPGIDPFVCIAAATPAAAFTQAILRFPFLRFSLCIQPKAEYDALITRLAAWKASHPKASTANNPNPRSGPVWRSNSRRNSRIHP
jgi:hypothetical protein